MDVFRRRSSISRGKEKAHPRRRKFSRGEEKAHPRRRKAATGNWKTSIPRRPNGCSHPHHRKYFPAALYCHICGLIMYCHICGLMMHKWLAGRPRLNLSISNLLEVACSEALYTVPVPPRPLRHSAEASVDNSKRGYLTCLPLTVLASLSCLRDSFRTVGSSSSRIGKQRDLTGCPRALGATEMALQLLALRACVRGWFCF